MGNHIVVMNEDRELIGAFFCPLFDPSKPLAYEKHQIREKVKSDKLFL